jgi:hypothetical protein
MERVHAEVNGARRVLDLREVARRFTLSAATLALALACAACGASERDAERWYRDAERFAEAGEPARAAELLEKIIAERPGGAVAAQAREKLVLYRGLADAVERYPQRRAREIVVATARAIERFKAAHGAPPDALDALVPDALESAPRDPWGRALQFTREGPARYRLASLGADGARGGAGDDADIVVVNGKFVEDVAP